MIVDEIKILKFARQDGIEEGIEQGIIRGIEEGLQQGFTVNKMLKKGKAIDEISKETGMSEEQIIKIKDELNGA